MRALVERRSKRNGWETQLAAEEMQYLAPVEVLYDWVFGTELASSAPRTPTTVRRAGYLQQDGRHVGLEHRIHDGLLSGWQRFIEAIRVPEGGRVVENAKVNVVPEQNSRGFAVRYQRLLSVTVPKEFARVTRHYRSGDLLPNPAALEIVQYADDTGYYLLYLDAAGNEQTDTYHDSVGSAMKQAEYEFGIRESQWRPS